MTGFHFPPQLSPDESDPAGHGGFHISSTSALCGRDADAGVADEASFSIARDESRDVFVATKDGVEFGGVLFDEKNDRVLLLATSILPEYRGMGLAAALTRRVLDSLHAEGKRVTVDARLPLVRAATPGVRSPAWRTGAGGTGC
jgi:predicted GNAT family acetyltransferase